MPIDLEIDPARNLVIRTVRGTVDNAAYQAAIAEQFEHPDFRTGMHILWDLREAEGAWDMDASRELAKFSQSNRARRGDGRFGIIASEELAYGLSRQYQAIGKDVAPEIGVFRTVEEALAWILDA